MNARTARQWMVTHEWMVKPMAQTEWIAGKGMLVWVAEVFSALGTGLYLVSLFFSHTAPLTAFWGGLFGWIMIAIFKLPLHLAYLGKPLRFWRSFPPFSNAWRTSWFARGIVFTMVFLGFGAVQLVLQGLIGYGVDRRGGHLGRQLRLHDPGRRLLRHDRGLLRLCHELLQERPLLEHRAAADRVPAHGHRRRPGPHLGREPGDQPGVSRPPPRWPPGSCSSSTPS